MHYIEINPVATASDDWDARSGKALSEPLRHEGWVRSAPFSPDGTRVVTASGDKAARVWDVFTVSPSDAEIVASLAERWWMVGWDCVSVVGADVQAVAAQRVFDGGIGHALRLERRGRLDRP